MIIALYETMVVDYVKSLEIDEDLIAHVKAWLNNEIDLTADMIATVWGDHSLNYQYTLSKYPELADNDSNWPHINCQKIYDAIEDYLWDYATPLELWSERDNYHTRLRDTEGEFWYDEHGKQNGGY